MKIVHVASYYTPQFGYQELFLTRGQKKLGNEVYLVTSNKKYPLGVYKYLSRSLGKRDLPSGIGQDEGVMVIRLNTALEVSNRTWLSYLERVIIELDPDIIYVHGIANFHVPRVIRLKRKGLIRAKLICDEHMVYNVVRKGVIGKLFYFLFKIFLVSTLLKYVDWFVAVTEETKQFMIEMCGIPPDRIKVILLGVDTDRFKFNEEARIEIRNKYNIASDEVVFIYTGKIIREKGSHLALHAGIELMKKYKNIKLFFLGNGDREYIESMKVKARQEGLEDRVIWHDAVDNRELSRFYSASDVGVWPHQESITTLEASSCKLPIIIRDLLSLHDRISNGNGLTYKDGDYLDLIRSMESLALDKGLRETMGKRGRELAQKRDWSIISREFIEIASLQD